MIAKQRLVSTVWRILKRLALLFKVLWIVFQKAKTCERECFCSTLWAMRGPPFCLSWCTICSHLE